ncbi:hypothetical protein FACS18942_11150 [Planctomycetales bacterium]|nr:hypothetical protein FACS18942_11150 [Planctomycetales bacterium]
MPLRPRGNRLWEKHVQIYCQVFRQALIALSKKSKLGKDELILSRQLYDLVRRECYNYSSEIAYPICEVPIVPEIESNDSIKLKKSGRPDFSCRFKNTTATFYKESERDFHIECKCLGTPNSKSWIFNKNYVNHGIIRFDQRASCYGEDVSYGMMIGYMLSMTLDDICAEVNAELKKNKPFFPAISFTLPITPLFESRQALKRTFIKPTEFTLFHFWVDLRKSSK